MARRRSLRWPLIAALHEVVDARGYIAALRAIEAGHRARAQTPLAALAAVDEHERLLAERSTALEREADDAVKHAAARIGYIDRQLPRHQATQRALLAGMTRGAPDAAPGWLMRPWPPHSGPPTPDRPHRTPVGRLVRVGRWRLHGVPETAPLLVPLLGRANLQIEIAGDRSAPGADEAAVSLLRGVVLRLLASSRIDDVRLLAADPRHGGAPFAAFGPLVAGGAAEQPTAVSLTAFRAMLERAEQHVARVFVRERAAGVATLAELKAADPTDDTPYLLLAIASFPYEEARADIGRLAMLARSGIAAGLHVLTVGCPVPLDDSWRLTVGAGYLRVGGLGSADAEPEPDPGESTVAALCRQIADAVRMERHRRRPTFSALLPAADWTETAVEGLRAVIGVQGGEPFTAAFDDVTPHWLIGGRAGSGKTAFLLDLVYALASRYSPDELAMYLLNFSDGGAFGEFTPSGADPSWLPHARAVGIEADREYGLAVLRALHRESVRRSRQLKRQGVSTLAQLRRQANDVALPRILAVIDEIQVLIDGGDDLAADAVKVLDEIARSGPAHGVHLALAGRADDRLEALVAAHPELFGRLSLRAALTGARGVLEAGNTAADALPAGQVVLNPRAGIAGANQVVTFPNLYEHPTAVGEHRRELWRRRAPGDEPPAVFEGSAAQRIADDPVYKALTPSRRPPRALVGRHLDATLSTASVTLSPAPGRHLAVLGTSGHGAGILHAAAMSLARQHAVAGAEFIVGCYLPDAEGVARDAARLLDAAGHLVRMPSAAELPAVVGELADAVRADAELADAELAEAMRADGELAESLRLDGEPADAALVDAMLAEAIRSAAGADDLARYLVLFGADAVSGRMEIRRGGRSGLDDLRTLLRLGPGRSTHVLSWWRTVPRFVEDIGGLPRRGDVSCLAVLNVPGPELAPLVDNIPEWRPRPNRALLIDRHADTASVLVPFAARFDDEVLR